MRRRIVMALLALGTIGGYAAGFAHMHHACNHGEWNGRNVATHVDCADRQHDSR